MTKDRIVLNVIEQFNDRSEVGINKYGTTLEENNKDNFLQHLQEELMDATLYVEKLKTLRNQSLIAPISKLKSILLWSDRIGSDEICEINEVIKLLEK